MEHELVTLSSLFPPQEKLTRNGTPAAFRSSLHGEEGMVKVLKVTIFWNPDSRDRPRCASRSNERLIFAKKKKENPPTTAVERTDGGSRSCQVYEMNQYNFS